MKRVSFVCLILLLAGAAAGWAAGSAEPAAATGPELVYWHFGNDEQIRVHQEGVEQFNEMNHGFTVRYVERPDSREAMAAAIAGGRGPDIFHYNQNVPWFFGDDSIYPLNEFVNDPDIGMDPEAFFPAPRQSVNYGGNVIAIPMRFMPGGVTYNRQMLLDAGLDPSDPPRTWAEFEEWALALTIREGGQVVQWGVTVSSVDWLLQEVMFANGGDWNNDDLSEYAPYPEELTEGLAWINRLVHELRVMPVPRGVSWVGAPEMMAGDAGIVNEMAAMQIGWGGFRGFEITNPNIEGGVFPIPRGPRAGDTVRLSTGYDGMHMMMPGQHAREGYLFAKWFAENKALEYAWVTGVFPAYVSDLTRYEDDPAFAQMIPHLMQNPVRRFHVFPARLDVRSEEPAMVENVLMGRFTPQEAVRVFKQHADRVFQENQRELQRFRENHRIVW